MKQFVGGVGIMAGMMAANMSLAQSQLPVKTFGCEHSRVGCPIPPIPQVHAIGNALSELLLAKLPVIGIPGKFSYTKTVGAAISDGGDFAIVKCTLQTGRAVFQYCQVTESNTSENLKVYTPVQFLQLLNK